MMDYQQILELFHPLMDPIVEGVIITDRNGMVLTCNQSTFSLFGLDPAESTSINLNNINGFNLRRAMMAAGLDEQEEDSELTVHHCEMSLEFDIELTVSAQTRWLRISTGLISLPGQEFSLRMIVLRDISAEKRLFVTMGSKEACGVATEDPDMLRLIERLGVVAKTDASVLMQGESGTGKTELARMLHTRSKRSMKSFVEVNCGAIPASLIETELFGHVRGAFTGAVKDRVGRFMAADGGTIFLDEISELPRELQPKLLRVLQDGEFEPVGSDKTVRVDVRVITASNEDLRDLVDSGGFRADLFYRIAVIPLVVPALRERPGDIPLLIRVIMKRLALRGYPQQVSLSSDAMRAFMNYPWPGNVRELANAVEHALICSHDGVIDHEALPQMLLEYCDARTGRKPVSSDDETFQESKQEIRAALRKANGNRTLAAQILGVDRSTLWRRMRRLNID